MYIKRDLFAEEVCKFANALKILGAHDEEDIKKRIADAAIRLSVATVLPHDEALNFVEKTIMNEINHNLSFDDALENAFSYIEKIICPNRK